MDTLFEPAERGAAAGAADPAEGAGAPPPAETPAPPATPAPSAPAAFDWTAFADDRQRRRDRRRAPTPQPPAAGAQRQASRSPSQRQAGQPGGAAGPGRGQGAGPKARPMGPAQAALPVGPPPAADARLAAAPPAAAAPGPAPGSDAGEAAAGLPAGSSTGRPSGDPHLARAAELAEQEHERFTTGPLGADVASAGLGPMLPWSVPAGRIPHLERWKPEERWCGGYNFGAPGGRVPANRQPETPDGPRAMAWLSAGDAGALAQAAFRAAGQCAVFSTHRGEPRDLRYVLWAHAGWLPVGPLARALEVKPQALVNALGWHAARPENAAWLQSDDGLWLRPALPAERAAREAFESIRADLHGPLGLLAEAYRRWLGALPAGDPRRGSPWGLAQWPLAAGPGADPAWAQWLAAHRAAVEAAGPWEPSQSRRGKSRRPERERR